MTKRGFTTETLPIRGKGAWVWYVSQCGGVWAMIDRARELGLDWLCIKIGDGASFGDGNDDEVFRRQFLEAVQPVHDAGLRLLSWSYNYLDYPMGEGIVATVGLQNGADGHIFDVEAEAEGKSDAASILGQMVRGNHPNAFLGYAPLPVIDYHPRLPYTIFNSFCNAALPQFYVLELGRGEYTFQRLLAMWRSSRRKIWQAPLLAAYATADHNEDSVAQSIDTYGRLVKQYRIFSVSFWRLDTITGPIERAVKEMSLWQP